MKKSNWFKTNATIDGYPNMDFEQWFQRGLMCYRYQLPSFLYKESFANLASEWRTRKKEIKMWHIRAFILGLKGDNREVAIEEGYVWPEPPKGWIFIFSSMGRGLQPIEIDFGHPVSRVFWSQDNGQIRQPPFKPGCKLNYLILKEMGLKCMTPCQAVYLDNKRERHLTSVR